MKLHHESKTAPTSLQTGPSPFFIPFALVFMLQLLSFPLLSLLPSYVIDLVTSSIPNSSHYMTISYIATVTSFALLILFYVATPCQKLAKYFQNKTTKGDSTAHTRLPFYISVTIILSLCSIAYAQAGFKIPILQSLQLESSEYGVYRQETEAAINASTMNLILYLALPYNIFVSFFITKKGKLHRRAISIILFFLTGLFFLAKSKIAIPIIIILIARTAYKKVKHKSLVGPSVLILSLACCMVVLSTRSSGRALLTIAERVVHGQWLGLPLYIWYYEEEKADILSYVNPTLLSLTAMEKPTTPGRELMIYLNPAGVEAGTAGNIPTYFIGEAYAIAGWPAAFLSTLYVSLYIFFVAWSFSRIPKTPFTCILYGAMLYKIATGLTNGLSAFLFSGTTIALLLVLMLAMASRKNAPPLDATTHNANGK